jgi:hypothetical protein
LDIDDNAATFVVKEAISKFSGNRKHVGAKGSITNQPTHGDPYGCIGFGEDLKTAKLDIREQLK